MKRTAKTYPAHQVWEQLSEYGYRENHQSEGNLHFRHRSKGTFISLPAEKETLTDSDLLLALGTSPTYYDIIWKLGK
ncbi:MAG: hypothetical protein K9G46_02770 [Flavobacteriales bacterium]|nr:hypothetical protein [Flavobacteriales bacterium]